MKASSANLVNLCKPWSQPLCSAPVSDVHTVCVAAKLTNRMEQTLSAFTDERGLWLISRNASPMLTEPFCLPPAIDSKHVLEDGIDPLWFKIEYTYMCDIVSAIQ